MVIVGNDGCVLLADRDAASLAEILQCNAVKGHGLVLTDQVATGEDGDVGKGGFSALTKGRCANGCHLKDATALVHHKGC